MIYEAAGEELSDQIKVELLSRAMYKEDKEEFAKHLSSLSPQVVRFFRCFQLCLALTLFDPPYFGPLKAQGEGRSDPKLLEIVNCSNNGFRIKFSQKSLIYDPV